MTVQNGSPVEATYTNSRLMSRTEDTNTIGKIDLNNADSASGDQITNIQAAINSALIQNPVPQTVSDGGSIVIEDIGLMQTIRMVSDGGEVTVSQTPFGTSAPSGALIVGLNCVSETDTVIIENSNDIDYGININGNITLSTGIWVLLYFNSQTLRWEELCRNV